MPRAAALVLAVSALIGGALVAVAPSAAATAPTVVGGDASRGDSTPVVGSGLDADAGYVVSSDVAEFAGGATSTSVTTDGTGRFTVAATIPQAVPLDTTSADLSVTPAGSDTAVATGTVVIDLPFIRTGADCPGQEVGLSTTGFPPGHYGLKATADAFPPTSFDVDADGVATSPKIILNADVAARGFSPRVTDADGDAVNVTTLRTFVPSAHSYLGGYDHLLSSGDCWGPGESLTVTSSPRDSAVPASSRVDRHGDYRFGIAPHADPRPHALRITVTSEPSGRSASAVERVPGTTVFAGHALGAGGQAELRSPTFGYKAYLSGGCQPEIARYRSHGYWNRFPDPVWDLDYTRTSQIHGRCDLVVRRTGDLVLVSARHGILWQSRTGGTGRNNRLVLGNGGRLTLRTAGGKVVWSSHR